MDVRGKLVELLAKYFTIGDSYAYNLTRVKEAFAVDTVTIDDFVEFNDEVVADIADHLIANGVTVQEWISVEDRLPKKCGMACLLVGVNCFGQRKVFQGFTGYMENGKLEWHTNIKGMDITVWTITHWQPLPQPPKGE